MAIFFPSSTPGYSDALKAMSIKALEQRQKDLLAQQAAQQSDAATMATIPGGIGHVLGIVGDQMREGRNLQAIADQKQQLATIMAKHAAGADWSGTELGQIGMADPGLRDELLKQAYEARQKSAQYAHEDTAQTSKQTFEGGQKEADRALTASGQKQQAELAREQMGVTKEEGAATRQTQMDLATQSQKANAEAAQAERDFKGAQAALDRANQDGTAQQKIDAQAALQEKQQVFELKKQAADQAFKASQPQSTVGQVGADVKSGIISPEVGAAAQQQMTAIPPAQVKAQTDAATTYRDHSQSLDKLLTARDLLNHPDGINVGPWAGVKTGTTLGAADIPLVGGMVSDAAKAKAQRTNDFNSIVNEKAIKEMSTTLKGQSTDFEMQKFIDVMNNPGASPEQRRAGLDRLITAAQIDKGTHANALRQLRGDPGAIDAQLADAKKASGTAAPAPAGGGGGGTPAPAPAGAGGGTTAVPAPPPAGDITSVSSEADALKLPPNTKFRLPDGRTGTAR
jgi:hypothetical protein